MASTSATRKQSEAIRAAMQEIRNDLPYDVDDARDRVKQLSDWKYHVSQRPFVVLGVAAAIGFLLVPSKRRPERTVVHHGSPPSPEPAKRGVAAGLMGTAATLLLRQVAAVASRRILGELASTSSAGRSAVSQSSPSPSEVNS